MTVLLHSQVFAACDGFLQRWGLVHLEPKPAAPSSHSLRGTGRRTRVRRVMPDPLPPQVLPAGESSSADSSAASSSLCCGRPLPTGNCSSTGSWLLFESPPGFTPRVAISNGRLLSLENGQVTFQWRDSKDNHQIKTMTLDAVEFIRRFLLHILPSGFVKIRHFGFLSRRRRRA